MTDCECPVAGFCRRHQCRKTEHWVHLCRIREDYFALWEEGRGPGQPHLPAPGLLRRALNLGQAVVKHALGGMQSVSDVEYQARLGVCGECASLDLARMMCREPDCGCLVEKKAHWRTENCPRGKWPVLPNGDQETTETESVSVPGQGDVGQR